MAVICYGCARNKGITTPPVRTRRAPCDFCGRDDEIPAGRSRGMNYDYPDRLIPGNSNDPNVVAEREENTQ